jgi:hypothetical protein
MLFGHPPKTAISTRARLVQAMLGPSLPGLHP